MISIRRVLGCFILLSITQYFVGGTPDIVYPFVYYGGGMMNGDMYGYGHNGNSFPSYGAYLGGSGVGGPFGYFGGVRDFGLGGYYFPPYTSRLMGGFGGHGYFGGINGNRYGYGGYGGRNSWYIGANGGRNYSNGGGYGLIIDDRSGGRNHGQRSRSGGRGHAHNARASEHAGVSGQGGRGYHRGHYITVPDDPYVIGMFPNGATSSRYTTGPYNLFTDRFYRFNSFPYLGPQQMFNSRMPGILRESRYIGSPDQYTFSGGARPIVYTNNMGGMLGHHSNRGGFSRQTLHPPSQGENRAPYDVVSPPMSPTPTNGPAIVVNDLPNDGTSPPASPEPVPNPEPPTGLTNASPPDAGVPEPPSGTEGPKPKHGKHGSSDHSASSSNYVVDGHRHP